MYVEGVFTGNVTVALHLDGMINEECYLGGVVRKYNYTDIWVLSLSGITKLCFNNNMVMQNFVMSYVSKEMKQR